MTASGIIYRHPLGRRVLYLFSDLLVADFPILVAYLAIGFLVTRSPSVFNNLSGADFPVGDRT